MQLNTGHQTDRSFKNIGLPEFVISFVNLPLFAFQNTQFNLCWKFSKPSPVIEFWSWPNLKDTKLELESLRMVEITIINWLFFLNIGRPNTGLWNTIQSWKMWHDIIKWNKIPHARASVLSTCLVWVLSHFFCSFNFSFLVFSCVWCVFLRKLSTELKAWELLSSDEW